MENKEIKEKIENALLKVITKEFKSNEQVKKDTSETVNDKVKEHDKSLKKHDEDIKKLIEQIKSGKWLLGAVILVLLWNILQWYYDGYYRLNDLKDDYIKRSEEIKSEIQLFQKEIDICKQKNNDFEKEVEKEVERQINNIIIRYGLNNKTLNKKSILYIENHKVRR